jgi:uncharacterized protein with HEPN domain
MKDDGTKDYIYIKHILECIMKIQKWHSEGKQIFVDDDKTQYALIRALQIMAESTQRLSNKARETSPEIEWTQISGFRNVIVHEYIALDVDEIWAAIEQDIPPLQQAMQKLLKEVKEV